MDSPKRARTWGTDGAIARIFRCLLRLTAVLCAASTIPPEVIAQQAPSEAPASKNGAKLAHVLADVSYMLGVSGSPPLLLDGDNIKVGQASISLGDAQWLRHDRPFELADVDWAFPAAKALVHALVDQNRRPDDRPFRTVGLLNECETVLGASAVLTEIAAAGRPNIDADFLSRVNTRIARLLIKAGSVELLSAKSPKVPLPEAVAGPTEIEPDEKETVYPWFDLPVTFLALSSGSGYGLARINRDSTKALEGMLPPAVVDYRDMENFPDWAQRLCARYMFIDEDATNYVRVKARSIRESAKSPSKVAAVDMDILNIGNRRLFGSLLVAVLGEPTNSEDPMDIQFARILDFDLLPKGKKRFVERIEYKMPPGRGIRFLIGPELDGPTAAEAVGPEMPIGTCAEKQLSSANAFRSEISKYAMDARNNFKNSRADNTGEFAVGYSGRYPIPGATEVVIFGISSKQLASVSAQLLHTRVEEQARKVFWATVRKLKQMCGEKAGEIVKREPGDDRERISFEIEQFGPRASLSLAVREVQASAGREPPGYGVSITIARHFRIFP